MLKQKYVPDLSQFISCCEVNFVKLLKLLPDDFVFERLCFKSSKMELIIEALDLAPHTLTIKLNKTVNLGFAEAQASTMEVRMYFDAKLAEVVKYQGVNRIKPSYPYPNKKMMQRNEKQQANEFLGEWLTFCLSQGYFSDKSEAVLPQNFS